MYCLLAADIRISRPMLTVQLSSAMTDIVLVMENVAKIIRYADEKFAYIEPVGQFDTKDDLDSN